MIEFLSNSWPVILAIFIVVVILAIIRAVRKFMREGGGAFRLETIKKSSEPNNEVLKAKSEALLADADMICTVQGSLVVPNKEDLALFKRAVGQKYKVIMFLIPKTDKVVYFFCKTEAGIKRRIENLLTNDRRKNSKWPYADTLTGEKLKYPKN